MLPKHRIGVTPANFTATNSVKPLGLLTSKITASMRQAVQWACAYPTVYISSFLKVGIMTVPISQRKETDSGRL